MVFRITLVEYTEQIETPGQWNILIKLTTLPALRRAR